MIVILDKPFANVVYDEELLLVTLTWKDAPLTFENYKETFISMLDFQKDKTVNNYIADIRQQRIISPHFRKWFQEEGVSRAVKQGLKKGAVIFNGNVFKKYYLNNIMNTTKRFGLPFKFFNSTEKAMEWFNAEMNK